MQKKLAHNTDHQLYQDKLVTLSKRPIMNNSNSAYPENQIIVSKAFNNSAMNINNPFGNENLKYMRDTSSPDFMNDRLVNDSTLSKPKASNYNSNDPSYISQFNDNDMYLAVGEPLKETERKTDKMQELREYFKKKIVNAYNSIYMENTGKL